MPDRDRAIAIASFGELKDRARAEAEIAAIFFETSGTQRFESDTTRDAYRARWLGRYLAWFPDEAFVALTDDGSVVGYLVGCLEDPAHDARFADIPYFAAFAALTAGYPAHLHINLTARYRGQGIGARLIERFAEHAERAGTPGVHVVTGEGARNNRFYLACGFRLLQTADWNGKRIAFFGRDMPKTTSP